VTRLKCLFVYSSRVTTSPGDNSCGAGAPEPDDVAARDLLALMRLNCLANQSPERVSNRCRNAIIVEPIGPAESA